MAGEDAVGVAAGLASGVGLGSSKPHCFLHDQRLSFAFWLHESASDWVFEPHAFSWLSKAFSHSWMHDGLLFWQPIQSNPEKHKATIRQFRIQEG